jgi:hypothetical protein
LLAPCLTDATPIGARTAKGGYLITLPRGVVDRLNYLREPGQSYSDVVLALVKEEAA